jgi:hypothetical protein
MKNMSLRALAWLFGWVIIALDRWFLAKTAAAHELFDLDRPA